MKTGSWSIRTGAGGLLHRINMTFIEDLIANPYVHSALILLTFIIAARLFGFLFKKYVQRLASMTKSEVDDIIVGAITRPIYVIIILMGAYIALRPFAQGYYYEMDAVFFIAYVLVIALTVSRLSGSLIAKWLNVSKKFEKTPKLITIAVSIVIYTLFILMILGHFNIEITPMIAAMGLGGLAVGLALQNTLSDFFSGIHIISDRPVRVGDFIELEGGFSGYVDDIGWRSTRIRTLPNTIVIVPNSKIAGSIITNDSMPDKEIAVLVQCGVGYGSDLRKVEKVTVDVARKIQESVPGAVRGFEPFIRYNAFGDSNINFSVIMRAEKFVDRYLIIHEFIKSLKEMYDRKGIEISWPVRKIYQGKAARR